MKAEEEVETNEDQEIKIDPEPVKIYHAAIGTKPRIDSTAKNCSLVDNTEHRFLEIVGQNTIRENEKELNKVQIIDSLLNV